MFFVNRCKAQTLKQIEQQTMCLEDQYDYVRETLPIWDYSFPLQTFGSYQAQDFFISTDLYADEEIIPIENPMLRQRVVLLGDSQTIGPLGNAFEQHFLNDFNAIAFGRSGMRGWGFYRWNRHRERIDRVISSYRPTIILLLLGGNDWSRSEREDVEMVVEDFWNYINSVSIFGRHAPAICWIESPAILEAPGIRSRSETQAISAGRESIGRSIQETIGHPFFIGTSDIIITEGRSEDGIHFTGRGAEAWYQAVIPRIETCVRNQTMQR